MKKDIILDMETADPDDVMTLCLAAQHSQINLVAVTVTPGTNEQIGLVKHILNIIGLNIPVGSYRIGYEKQCVSHFHNKWIGKFEEKTPDNEGYKVIQDTVAKFPDVTLLTGAPLKNMSTITDTIMLSRWVGQGGFAGDNIVPIEYRLPKFDGRITCPTFNFNGDPTTATNMLAAKNILKKYLVSKNVCHGIVYDQEMHEQFAEHKNKSAGLSIVYKGMDLYLKKKPLGKKFHDPLALAVAIDTSVCEFAEVKMYRKKGEWGANPSQDSNTFISINANKQKMINILTDTL